MPPYSVYVRAFTNDPSVYYGIVPVVGPTRLTLQATASTARSARYLAEDLTTSMNRGASLPTLGQLIETCRAVGGWPCRL